MRRLATSTVAIAGLILLLSTMSGCASHSYGTKLNKEDVDTIQKGVTTRDELVLMFGKPMSVGMGPNGTRTAIWTYAESNAHAKGTSFIPFAGPWVGGTEGTSEHQQLQVTLRDNIVEDFEFTDNIQEHETTGMNHQTRTVN